MTTPPNIPELPPTIAELPFFASGRFPKPDSVGQCTGESVTYVTGRELLERVRDISLGLLEIGMADGECVALLSENRPEWLMADLAVQAAGAITVPIYPTMADPQVGFILRDSGARIAVVSTRLQLQKVINVWPDTPELRAVACLDAHAATERAGAGRPVSSLADIEARGHQRIRAGWGVAREFHDRAKRVRADDLATIIYTSGTTGQPKGVMLTHGNLVANIAGVHAVLALGPDDVALSFLPLCHAFERLVAYVYLSHGVSIVFAESFNTIGRDLQRVRPTVLTGVPRVFEKLQERILAKGRAETGPKRWIFNWAMGVAASGRPLTPSPSFAKRSRRSRLGRGRPSHALSVRLAERLVFHKIREGLGGRLRFAVSGGAPLQKDVGRFFHGLGLPLLEGYGLTETAPVLTVMPLEAIRFGTVGRPLPNVEIQIAPDGEVLARGPNVMRGYFHRPEETSAVLRDGWFHTGDVGTVDADGYLSITDRKKEIIVTSGGKNVAPQPIESAFRTHPLVAEAVLIGERRPYLSLLIVPDFERLARTVPGTGLKTGGSTSDVAAALERREVRALYQAVVDAINPRLAQFERIKRFALLPRELSMAEGELTPTLKVKRRVIDERYREVIEGLSKDNEAVRQ
jgi:long-chain acyl-CoA synthetase